ncbi:hypothetical protein BDR06DRAFT_1007122 [Suillus hirtellus]|nr:hypothetical protein BDR06DRAFT_1007122 [Suillus hirtellus]
MPPAFSASYHNFQMSLDSSILPYPEPRIKPEANANMVLENVQEYAHPNDVAAMQAKYSILPYPEPRIKPEANANMVLENIQEFAHPNDVAAMQAEWAQACAEYEYLKEHQWSSAALQVVRGNHHTAESKEDSSNSSSTLTTRKCRCLDDDDKEIREGKFGFYRLADATAVIMSMPVHNPKPVDTSSHRAHDFHGNVLRTRTFRVMELDDSYTKRSITIRTELPAGMTCV